VAHFSWRPVIPPAMALLLLVLLLQTAGRALAHEGRPVGPYIFVVGFSTEPALEGLMNGVDLRVSVDAEPHSLPVEGLEQTLQVEVIHVPSQASKIMNLRPVFGDPGRYTADFIPTAPGEYRLRFFGTIEDLAVDEIFESGPDTYSDVETAQDFQFPNPVPQPREFESAIRGSQQAIKELQDSVRIVTLLVVVALILALIGAVTGLLALVSTRRQR
jgi:hypothetical protein